MSKYAYNKTIEEFDFLTVNMEIEEFCEENKVLPNKVFAIQLILEELVTNIIKYGSKDENEKKEMIEVALTISGDMTKLEISDNAGFFDPLKSSEPDIAETAEERSVGGLGLFLVRKMVKSLTYENKDGFNVVIAQI